MKYVLFLALILSVPSFATPATKKRFLSAPAEHCHPIKCVKLAPGVSYYYDDGRKTLAYGTLAEDVDMGGIKAPKGAILGFAHPSDHMADHQFYIHTKKAQTWGGVEFSYDSTVKFIRFKLNFDKTVDGGYAPIADGWVRVKGTTSLVAKIEGVQFAPGEVTFTAKVDAGELKDTHYSSGTVYDDVTLPATDPVKLFRGDKLEATADRIQIKSVSRAFGAEGYFGRNADIWKATGKLLSIDLEKPFTFKKIELLGPTVFFKSGNVALGRISKNQTIFGILVSTYDSSGNIAFFENGSPASFNTHYVDDNAAFLPDDFSKLPAKFTGDCSHSTPEACGRLQFFFSPATELRAVKHEAGPPTRIAYRTSYTARAIEGGLEFTLVKDSNLNSLLASGVGRLAPDLEEYLTTGEWNLKKP